MRRSAHLLWMFLAMAFVAVAASAFAAPPPIGGFPKPGAPVGSSPTTIPHGILTPPPLRPIAPPPLNSGQYVGAVPPGTKVPLSRLPRLAMKTFANTATPKNYRGLRPMAASGAYIDITNTNCANNGALGDQFNVGCTLAWFANGLPNNADQLQDYYVYENNANESTASATAVGGTYPSNGGDTLRNTALNNAGTYIFGVYDTTTSQWVAIIYVNAGQVYALKVYQDPFHTQETYQFDASTSNNAYIYLQNVAQGDYYVVGINQTSVAPNCVFMGPAPLPSPYTYPANQLCNLTLSTGVQAAGGDLSVTWPIQAGLAAGTYSVEVYDLTVGQRVAQVQVSVTGASGVVIITKPDVSGVNANPSPNPAPAATAGTTFDWDGTSPIDESVTGLTASITGLTNGSNYQWTLSDPQGQVIGTYPATVSGTATSQTITFDALTGGAATMLAPGQYPANSFTLQFYNTTSKTVLAAQSFKVLGYSTQTQFNAAGTLTNAIVVAQGGAGTLATMQFTNTSNGIFNGFGDNLNEVEFSTGPDFTLSTTSGNGVMVGTTSGGVCTPTCTTSAVDSTGKTWNVTITCAAGGLTKNGECNVLMTPAATSTRLAPNAYITLSNLYFFSATGAGCGNACQGVTSELPSNGVKWSTTSSALAWTPVYFRKNSASESGTATFAFAGSENQGTRNINGSPFAAPFVGTHFYQSNFNQADYNNNSPYSVPASLFLAQSNEDIWSYTINNTGNNTISEIALGLPPLLLYQGFYNVDTLSSGTWGVVACPANFSTAWFCLSGGTIAKGTSTTIYIDQSLPLQSFPFTEIQMEAFANSQWFSVTPTATTQTTPDGLNTVDSLAVGAYSLIGTDMSVYPSPSTIGQGSTPNMGFSIQNTSTSVDPNPDAIDAIVIEAPSTGLSLGSVPTVSNAGWSYLGSFKLNGSTSMQYWFGLCGSQYTKGAVQGAGSYAGPPGANGAPVTTPFTSTYPTIGTCGNETDAAGPGTKVNISNMKLSNFNTSGTQTWKMYAHGANAGGWSAPQNFTITVTPESAEIWFNQVNGTAVATNTVPTIGGSPNSYQYAVKNTSGTSKISTINVTLPGLDINNQNAFDGTNTWNISSITSGGVTITAPGGQADGTAGCTVNSSSANTFNPTTAGANGQIQVNCTNLNPGDTIYLNFTATSPQVQSDSYLFPATIDGSNAGVAWLGSDEVTVQFSLGLNVVVDPSNPGPGGSTPVVSCQNSCAFSGTTIDFGNIGNNTTYTFSDVVRTSVIYTGATSAGHTLLLYTDVNSNPVNTGGSASNELLSDVDPTNSTQGAGIAFNQTSYAVMPTTSPGMLLATIPETYSSTGYDVIDNYEVTIGTETVTGHIVTVTYTVIAN